MGTTLDQIATGHAAIQWVVAIEGYEFLITDGSTAAALTAWAGTDWTQALGGLVIQGEFEQTLDPWDPFPPGGIVTLHIHPDNAAAVPDQFGIDINKTAAGAETYLTASIDGNDTNIAVKRADEFTAATSDMRIGCETIRYSAKTSTTFTASQRGRHAPFKAGTGTANRWGRYHRVGNFDYATKLEPVVSQQPRNWIGKWVGIWMHRRQGTVLDTKAQAQLVFAGQIAEVQDDPGTFCTVVACKNVIDTIADTSLMRDQFTGKIVDGVFLIEGRQFALSDTVGSGAGFATLTATPLSVVAGGVPPSQIPSGYHTLDELTAELNAWAAFEKNAGRLNGFYTFAFPQDTDQGPRSMIRATVNAGATDTAAWKFGLPAGAAKFLGFTDYTGYGSGNVRIDGPVFASDTVFDYFSQEEPYRAQMGQVPFAISSAPNALMSTTAGVFVDQRNQFPDPLIIIANANGGATYQWGVVMLDQQAFLVARLAASPLVFQKVYRLQGSLTALSVQPWNPVTEVIGRKVSDISPLEVRQIFLIAGTFAPLVLRLFASTGTGGAYNGVYDEFPYGLGLAIPAELLGGSGGVGGTFETSCVDLGEAFQPIIFIIDKPITVRELIGPDLIMRRAALVWKNGTLAFTSWTTPSASVAIHTFDESTKAVSPSVSMVGRSATTWTSESLRNIAKIRYNRKIGTDEFQGMITLEDRSSIDDHGGHPIEIKLRNTYAEYANTGVGIEALGPDFLAYMTLFSRPIRKMTRSIDMRFFENVAPGDVALVTDPFARDPLTGLRGITLRPALIIRHRFDWGGPTPGQSGQTRDMVGEVDLLFVEIDRIVPYCPAAHLDETADAGGFTSGYNNGTRTIRCRAHQYSETTEAVDASHFVAGDRIRIVQIDPSNPAAPLTWDRIVESVSTNDIVITVALSAPTFDDTLLYRLYSDTYGDAQATQRSKAYQADDADGKIENIAPPNLYNALYSGAGWFTLDLATAIPERYVSLASGDGAALDVGNETAMMIMTNNLIDRKTAINSPMLEEVASRSVSSPNWELVHCSPFFAGVGNFADQTYTGSFTRYLYVAPFFRSSTGGTCSLRVTLQRVKPSSTSNVNIVRGSPLAEATFTTTSTTYATPSAVALDMSILADVSSAWLLIELQGPVETRGLSRCSVGPRE